ncbi:hypothetical protein [Alloactinosynnema sp. L-07]|nr:hypothetical protein [Alloactinosynnema sp. L-07]
MLVDAMPDIPGGFDGVLGVCLLVVLAVLLAAAALRRSESRTGHPTRAQRVRWARRTCRRTPRLEQLCVLRA